MNKTPSEYIIQFLADRGVLNWASAEADWSTIIGTMPDNDDNQDDLISVLDTGAELDGVIHRTGKSVQHPTFQFFIRDIDYPDALKKGKQIEESLMTASRTSVTVDGHSAVIQAVQIRVPTTFLKEQEKNRRQLFVLNIQATMWEV